LLVGVFVNPLILSKKQLLD